jgi:hypothetical protein
MGAAAAARGPKAMINHVCRSGELGSTAGASRCIYLSHVSPRRVIITEAQDKNYRMATNICFNGSKGLFK